MPRPLRQIQHLTGPAFSSSKVNAIDVFHPLTHCVFGIIFHHNCNALKLFFVEEVRC